MAKDRFGYGTEEKNPRKDFLSIINDEEFRFKIEKWLDSEPNKSDYASYRAILKKMFPGSGLITELNKDTGEKRYRATYTGPDTKEGRKEFEMYQALMPMLAQAKGLEIPSSIVLSSELAKIYATENE
tara:strand:- start:858 stop:1241 length:384 start_codon:yes stop_codon:yes gene_type:complete